MILTLSDCFVAPYRSQTKKADKPDRLISVSVHWLGYLVLIGHENGFSSLLYERLYDADLNSFNENA